MRAVLWLFLAVPAAAQMPPYLDPAVHRSPSGRWEFRVDPTERHGAGEADCELSRDGELVWSQRLPFTPHQAALTDDGLAIGVAYTNGLSLNEGGEMIVATVDAEAGMCVVARAERRTRDVHWSDEPYARGVILQPDLGRAIVRVRNGHESEKERWWIVDLERMERVDVWPIGEALAASRAVIAARAVLGTPLTLVHTEASGIPRFVLLDDQGKAVWEHAVPDDYREVSRSRENAHWFRAFYRGEGIPEADPGRFSVVHFAEGEVVTFLVREEAAALRVEEVGRAPFDKTPPEPAWKSTVEAEPIELASRGTLPLAIEILQPRGRLEEWRPIPGGLEAVYADGDDAFRWVRLDLEGRKVGSWRFEIPRGSSTVQRWCRLSDGPWVLVRDAQAWRIDPRKETRRELEGYREGYADRVAPWCDGFVVAGYRERPYVEAYLADGSIVWTYEAQDRIRDLAQRADGLLAALGPSRLVLLGGEGGEEATHGLSALLGKTPSYPRTLGAGPDGSLLLIDDGGKPELFRLSTECAVTPMPSPSFPDGRAPAHLGRRARFGPEGHLWSNDGEVFVRLDGAGVVELVVGRRPEVGKLHRVRAFLSDERGRILVVDAVTGAVHVFDAGGRGRLVCAPGPDDFPDPPHDPHIAVDGDGRVYVERRFLDHALGCVVFDAEAGRRLGVEAFPGQARFLPGSRERWVTGLQELLRVSADGRELLRLERRPDGRWLGWTRCVAVGSDGSLAVFDGDLHLYDRGGSAIVTHPLDLMSGDEIARGRGWTAVLEWTVLREERALRLVRERDGASYRAPLPDGIDSSRVLDLATSPDRSELWVFVPETATIWRFAWPEVD